MANEINLSAALSVSNAGVSSTLSSSKSANLTSGVQFQNTQNVGTSAEALNLGEAVFTTQYLMIKNTDVTNYVEIALDAPVTAQVFAKLNPGDFIIFPPKTSTLYAKANTAPVVVAVEAVGT